jgi:hypothetical protein
MQILVKLDRDAVTSSVPRSAMELWLSLHTTETPVHVEDFDPQILGKRAESGSVELRWIDPTPREHEESTQGVCATSDRARRG